jgi:hypothetical protein
VTDLIDDEWTEAVDANIPRVDLVGKAANGSGGFLLMKQDAAGLMDPAHIRSLIAKAEPEPEAEAEAKDTVTMTGSPAAIAKMIHHAAQRHSVDVTAAPVVKAKYDADDLKRMAANGQAMADGSYPIADKEDLGRAIRAVGRGGASHDAIRHHIMTRAKSLGASSEIPDNWGADGSLKKANGETSEVAKVMDMDMDDGVDGMDPTVVLACPDEMAPGDPTDPGSPAWESIDAATARKWTSILARARSALGIMADREALEGATVDPDDMGNAMDLDDAACAIDYVISVLAPFAVDEQAEADCGSAEMDAIGKALHGFDPAPLDTIEALGQVRKAGRVLSTANEAAIRGAVDSLTKVLASLPAAPTTEESGQSVAKTANEEPDMPTATPSEDVTADSGQAPAMGTMSPEAKPVAGTAVTDMAKAAKPAQVAIYDANGNLVGTVDPAEITMLTPAQAPASTMDDAPADTAVEPAPAAEPPASTAELTPAPSAEAGTPSDAPDLDDNGMAKATADTPQATIPETVLKSDLDALFKAAIDNWSATHMEVVAKQAAGLAKADVVTTLNEQNRALKDEIEDLRKTVKTIEDAPAVMAVMGNGAVPPQHLLRGQEPAPVTSATQAQQLRKAWSSSDRVEEQARLGDEMQRKALDAFEAMRQTPRR